MTKQEIIERLQGKILISDSSVFKEEFPERWEIIEGNLEDIFQRNNRMLAHLDRRPFHVGVVFKDEEVEFLAAPARGMLKVIEPASSLKYTSILKDDLERYYNFSNDVELGSTYTVESEDFIREDKRRKF